MALSQVASVVMLGNDHRSYGVVDTASLSNGIGAAISVGADKSSPSLRFKGTADVPNEDALLAFATDRRVVMAVADAHFGHEASHQLIVGLAQQLRSGAPPSTDAIREQLAQAAHHIKSRTESESTLAVAVFDRQTSRGFGLSFGDSSVALVGQGGFRQLNERDDTYINIESVAAGSLGVEFEFASAPGELLVLFTDGVDECHYRQPATSVRPQHITELAEFFGEPPEVFAGQLAALALAGVDGNPGGQDNIAIVAAAT